MTPTSATTSLPTTPSIDIAHYFAYRAQQERGEQLSALKIQKLVYYAQAWSLVFCQAPLFADGIEAWRHGPVVRSLWKAYPALQAHLHHTPPPSLPPQALPVLDCVWQTYGGQSARSLSHLTHTEQPWLQARYGNPAQGQSPPISIREMQRYYQRFVDLSQRDRPRIDRQAVALSAPQRLIPTAPPPSSIQTVLDHLRSPQPCQNPSLRQAASQALAALAQRPSEAIALQDWAKNIAADVAHAVD